MSDLDTFCEIFSARRPEDIEHYHIPSSSDLEDGSPSNTQPSEIRLCHDSRGYTCAYYFRLKESSDYFTTDVGLCLYHYRKN